MLWFVVAASGITAAVIALFAVFGATRQNLSATLAEHAGRITLSRGTQRTRAGLAAAQIALSLALLVGAHLLIGSFLALQKADLGFSSDRFLAARVNLSGDAFDSIHARAAYVDAAVTALGSEPGVAAVAATSSVPGVDAGGTVRLVTDAMDGDDHIEAQSIAVTSQFADALGLTVIDGREFTASEQADPDGQVAMLNEGLAARLWRGESAVGKRIGIQGGQSVSWLRIVGVMPDVGYGQVGRVTEPTQLHLYLPYARSASRAMAFVVRASGEPRVAARAGSPDASPGTRGHTGVRRPDDTREQARRQSRSGIRRHRDGGARGDESPAGEPGVYGLVADSARQREREMAIRLVLGATPSTIIWLCSIRRGAVASREWCSASRCHRRRGRVARQPDCRPCVRAADVRECGRDSAGRRHGRGVPAGATRVSHRSRGDPASELSVRFRR